MKRLIKLNDLQGQIMNVIRVWIKGCEHICEWISKTHLLENAKIYKNT